MDLAEVFVGHVRIDLRGCDVGVPEKCLDRTQIGTVFKEIGGKRVANDVRSDFLRNTRLDSVLFDELLDRAGSDTTRCLAAAAVAHEKCLVHVFARLEVRSNCAFRVLREEDDAHLVTLAAH